MQVEKTSIGKFFLIGFVKKYNSLIYYKNITIKLQFKTTLEKILLKMYNNIIEKYPYIQKEMTL